MTTWRCPDCDAAIPSPGSFCPACAAGSIVGDQVAYFPATGTQFVVGASGPESPEVLIAIPVGFRALPGVALRALIWSPEGAHYEARVPICGCGCASPVREVNALGSSVPMTGWYQAPDPEMRRTPLGFGVVYGRPTGPGAAPWD